MAAPESAALSSRLQRGRPQRRHPTDTRYRPGTRPTHMTHPRIRHRLCCPHADRQVPRCAEGPHRATELGALVVREAVARAGIEPALVDECLMGNVLQAGNGQNPARQAALNGGLEHRVAAMTINKVCGSGLKAVMLAAQGIATGDIDVAVAGGMESMSNAPYLLPRVREGLRMGNGTVVDSMIADGLWCSFDNCHMGMSGEVVAETYHVERCEQDRYAAESHRRAAHATREGWFRDEILPVSVPQKKGAPVIVDRDEPIREDTSEASLAALKPAFKKDGTVTAGNAPGVNDGAAALVVMAAEVAASSRPHASRANRRSGHERTRAEDGHDDAGRGGAKGRDEGRLEAGRGRPLRDQRGLLGAARGGHARARHRLVESQRERRRRRARASDRSERCARPDDAALRDEAAERAGVASRRCASAAETAWRWQSSEANQGPA